MNYISFKTKRQNKFILWCVMAVAVIGIVVATFFVSKASGDNRGYRTIGVVETKGNVTVVRDGVDYKAYPGMHLHEGQILVTAGESSIRLVLDGDKYIKVEGGSRVVFETLGLLGSGRTKIVLERGSLTGELVNPLETGQEFVVNTPNAILAVRGTYFRVAMEMYGGGEVRTNVLTYGGAVGAKRVFPSGEMEEEEVLIDSGYKTAIHMDAKDTFYVLEKAEETTDIADDDYKEPIYREDISDDEWVDIYYSAENDHELFVTAKEAKKEIENRNISLENTASVYDKATEVFPESEDGTETTEEKTEVFLNIFADDSKALAMAEVQVDSWEAGNDLSTGQELQDGLLTDGSGGEIIDEEDTIEEEIAEEETIEQETIEEEIAEAETIEQEIVKEEVIGEEVKEDVKEEIIEEEIKKEEANKEETNNNTSGSGNAGNNTGNNSGSNTGSGGSVHTHEYTDEVTREASCTEAGIRLYSCACGDSYEEAIDATGHTPVAGGEVAVHSKCETCGETLSATHEYADEITLEATCTEEGIWLYSCECGHSYEKPIDATGHTPAAGGEASIHSKCDTCGETLSATHEYTDEVTQEATCTEDGIRLYSCECGHSYEETIDAAGHTPVDGGEASIHSKCDTCGETLSATHEYTDEVTQEATCTEDGIRLYSCECGYSYEESIDATGHTSVDGGEAGIHSKCGTCGETLSATHEYTDEVTLEATCTEEGIRLYSCECGYSYEESIDATGHTPVDGGEASIHSKCGTCGETLSAAHEYTDEVTQEATCTAVGERLYSCACGYSYTEEIPTAEHNYVTTINAPTDTQDGNKYDTCDDCGEVANEEAIWGINSTNFPNEAFRNYVEATYNTDGEVGLCETEIAVATSMTITADVEAENLYGIELFTSLETLVVESSYVQEIDVSSNAELSTLTLSAATGLTTLNCSYTAIGVLNVDNLNNLTRIDAVNCSDMLSLSAQNCTNLSYVDAASSSLNGAWFAGSASLVTLNLSNNMGLSQIHFQNCSSLSMVDVTNCGGGFGNCIIYGKESSITTQDMITGFDSSYMTYWTTQ